MLKFGRRLVTVDVVPLLQLDAAQHDLQRAHQQAVSRTTAELLTALHISAPPQDIVVLRLLLTHGLIDATVAHTGGFAVLPLPVLRRILRDCDDSDTGRDQLCQFLEDLNFLEPNIEYVLPADADDLWTHWQRYGGLLPATAGPIEPHAVIAVAPTLYDPQWTRAAALEPYAAAADAAHLPRLSSLPSVVTSGGQLSVVGPAGRDAGYVCPPDTVVTTDLEPPIDPTLAHAAASALCRALHDSGLAAAAAGRTGVYQLNVTITRGTQGRLAGDTETGWHLTIAEAFLRDAVSDPHTLHATIGDVLATPHIERPGVRHALTRWHELPPSIILGAHPTPARPHTVTRVITSSPAAANKAARLITAEIRGIHGDTSDARQAPTTPVAAGTYTGADAVQLVRIQLYPAAMRALARATHDLNGIRAVRATLACADAAHQERAQRRQALDIALTTADADAFRTEALNRPDDASLTRGLEVLTEQLLAAPGHGDRIIDRFDIAVLTAICEAALLMTIGADHANRGTGTLTIHVTSSGAFTTVVSGRHTPTPETINDDDTDDTTDDPTGDPTRGDISGDDHRSAGRNRGAVRIDAEAWIRAVRADQLETERPAPTMPEQHDGQFRQVLTAPDVPGRLRDLDTALRRAVGCGIESVIAVLATAAAWPDDVDLPDTTADALARDAAEWANTLEPSEIDAAISLLTLDGAAVTADNHIWEQERRAHRLLLRPLVTINGRLLIPRHICTALQNVVADFIGDGRLPWPDLPEEVKTTANQLRGVGTRGLERYAAGEVASTGLPHIANLDVPEAAQAGISGLPGEIDVLVADATSRTLWVIEVKDHIPTASGYSVHQRVRRFTSRNGYETKLLAKTAAIRQNLRAAVTLLHLDIAGSEGAWHVKPVMATHRIEPAAFGLLPPLISYVLVDRLAQHLTGPDQSYGTRSE